MTTPTALQSDPAKHTIAVLGNPNVGKTTLFNRIAGIRAKTSNFPGTTQEARVAHVKLKASREEIESVLIDLPGIYSLHLDLSESRVCADVLDGTTAPAGEQAGVPDVLLVVIDATNLMRNLAIVGESLGKRLPTVVAVNMIDAARRRGIHIDPNTLSECLGCPVILCSARTGEGVKELASKLASAKVPTRSAPTDQTGIERWAQDIYTQVSASDENASADKLTDRLDRAFTHPILGVLSFTAIMTGLFWMIFKLAAYPMDWIDIWFGSVGGWVGSHIPDGAIHDLMVDGVIAGVGGTVIFLPQICLLFFLLALLEGTGYLARAAFVIDRALRPFGLSGHAFVPLLSSHACAIPGIMAARAIPDKRDRLATILVAPFMSCTARIPVYVLLTSILFPDRPLYQAYAFTMCYAMGIFAGLFTSLLFRRTILRGKSRPMALELPSYRIPDLKSALLLTYDRGLIFLKKAGTLILSISIVLWWLGAYPHSAPTNAANELRAQAESIVDVDQSTELYAQADSLDTRNSAANSMLGKLGTAFQPIFAPLGYDRQLTVGVLASFAAREVFVSTMAVQVAGSDDVDDDSVLESIANATNDDGSRIFTYATSWSLLFFYVLASLCLPTLVVTAKEAGGWKWAMLQFGWMSLLAYVSALAAYQFIIFAGGT
ncbi:MAG: ferrous iron transporter B [Phycisphaerales bacterium]|nr:ferrous iron transporter B [Phycisphaerales bacterium]